MSYNFRQGGDWQSGIPKIRFAGQWVAVGDDGGDNGGGGEQSVGFTWDQTYTDTSWLTDADSADNLNVETVTTTNATGSGSITEAISNSNGQPTVIVFEVGGVIDLGGDMLLVDQPETWIAGETAPDPGISIIKGMVRPNADNVIMTHLGIYLGDQAGEADALNARGNDQLYDHCTLMWGVDETVGQPDDCDRISFINGIVAEGLYDSVHSEGHHSAGYLVNKGSSTDLCLYGTLFAHNNRRNPFTRGDMIMINNYIYNFGGRHIISFDDGGPDVTAKGIFVEHGDSSDMDQDIFIHGSGGATLYAEDIDWTHDGNLTNGTPNLVDSPPAPLPSGLDLVNDVMNSAEVRAWTMANSGMRPANRPPVDRDLIENRLTSGNGLADSQNDVGGYPNYSTSTRTLSVPGSGIVDWIKTNHTAVVEGTT